MEPLGSPAGGRSGLRGEAVQASVRERRCATVVGGSGHRIKILLGSGRIGSHQPGPDWIKERLKAEMRGTPVDWFGPV